jgi:hypothetical protein
MAQKPDEARDIELAERLLSAGTQVVLRPFSKAEMRKGQTPDRKIFVGATLGGFCEIKSPRDDWLDQELEGAASFEIRGGIRIDPTFNRIGRQIEKAATQFDAVNRNHSLPNVLVCVNNATASNFGDLKETLTGEFHAASGERFPTVKNVSEGRLKAARDKIDAFAWIDLKTGSLQGWLFNRANPDHVKAVCKMFGLNEADIAE